MKHKLVIALIVALVVGGVLRIVLFQGSESFNVIGLLAPVLTAVVVVGILVRWIRATPGNRVREAFGPVMAAGDSYQSLFLARPTAAESTADAKATQRVNKAFDEAKDASENHS